ncbi:MAG: YfiT family bacillithiol transferase [Gemmatimonadaceae bacterium]
MPDLRYPLGKFAVTAPVTPEIRTAAIWDLAALPERLRAAVNGLTDTQLDTPYRPEGWTVRQVVHHMADSHLNAMTRVRLALTEDTPTIKPYIEGKWAELADARTLAVEPSLQILEGVHARLVALLRTLDGAGFARTVVHPEHGRSMSVDVLVALYGWPASRAAHHGTARAHGLVGANSASADAAHKPPSHCSPARSPKSDNRDRGRRMISAVPLPHHRTCGSASGGSVS